MLFSQALDNKRVSNCLRGAVLDEPDSIACFSTYVGGVSAITTRFSVPERSEGEERSDESTPLLGTNQIHEFTSVSHCRWSIVNRDHVNLLEVNSHTAREYAPHFQTKS